LLKNTSTKGGKAFSIYSNETGTLVFGDEDAQRGALLVTKEGYVGVGPALPTAGLHVQQSFRVGSGRLVDTLQTDALFINGNDSRFLSELGAGDILIFDDDNQGTAFAKVKNVESDLRVRLEGKLKRLDRKGDFTALTHRAGGGMPFRVASSSLRVSDFQGATGFEVTAEGDLTVGKLTFGKERTLVAGASQLRIVFGQINNPASDKVSFKGGGFTIGVPGLITTITFSQEFSSTPTINVTLLGTGATVPVVPSPKSFTVQVPSGADPGFCFTAIGLE
jgi:hypothetical protein